MSPLKRDSCEGCKYCGGLENDLQDMVCNDIDIEIDKIVPNAKYYLCVNNISRDWETGVVDDWDLIFKLIEE